MSTCVNINSMKQDLKKVLDKKPFNRNDLMVFLNKYGIKYDNKFEQNIKNTCENVAINTGLNIVEAGSDECRKAINDNCKELFPSDEQKFKECKKMMRPKVKNVTQSNISDIDSSCYISAMTRDLQKDNDYKFAVALNSLIAGAPDYDCAKLSADGSVDSYFMNLNKCINDSSSNQKNYISACGNVSDVVQKNMSKIVSDCSIANEVKPAQQEEKTQEIPESSTITPIQQISDQKESSKTLYWVIGGSVGVLILLLIIIVAIVIRKRKKV